MMRLFFAGLLAAVLFSTAAKADGFEPGMIVGAYAGCKSESAVIAIAKADIASQEQAEMVFRMYAKAQECGMFPRPIAVEVVSVLFDYKDYGGTPSQVLEVVSGQGVTFYIITVKELAKDAPRRSRGI